MTDHALYTLGVVTAGMLLAYVVLWSGLQTFNANPSKRFMRIWCKLALYYAAYTMPMWALWLLVGWSQALIPMASEWSVSWVMIAVLAMGLYFYSVIVQPNRLRVEHQAIDLGLSAPLTVAVLADLRVGLYSGKPRHIRKMVATINALSADAVLITGDWLYYPSADLVGQLMLFKGVNKPVYTVMSTSDLRYQSINTTKQGQPLLEDTLACAFDVLDISYIGQHSVSLALKDKQTHEMPAARHFIDPHQDCDKAGQNDNTNQDSGNASQNNGTASQDNDTNVHDTAIVATLCGWQDIPKQSAVSQAGERAYKATLIAQITEATKPVILLASRFDSITDMPKSLQPRPLLITGGAKPLQKSISEDQGKAERHLDGEQWLSRRHSRLHNRLSKQQGLYQYASAQVFISSGIGTRGLPFRLSRPTIDVLTIR